ncbi:hypothetical protein V1282_005389 [Nitrobacteraceae bacterium AZCC 2146]
MPTQSEALVERYMRAAGVAAVSIDGTGAIGLVDVVGLDRPRDQFWLCCPAGVHRQLHQKAIAGLSGPVAPTAAVGVVEATARAMRISLTPHEDIVERAGAAVLTVEQRMHDLQANGALKELNQRFKRERQEGSKVSYRNFMHAKRLELIEAIARS